MLLSKDRLFTKEQIVGEALIVVDELNKVFQGLTLNGTICLPKCRDNAIKDCFLARAKDLIMESTKEKLESAFDECAKSGSVDAYDYFTAKDVIARMFQVIGNRAPNPENEKPIESVWFGYV